MSKQSWLTAQESCWERLEALLAKSAISSRQLPAEEIREMALLYRGVMNDLSRVRSLPELHHLEPYLNNLAQRCHGRVYERPPASWRDVLRFFVEDFPRCFRKNSLLIGLAGLLFILGTGVAMLTIQHDPSTETYFLPPPVIAELDRGILWTDNTQANPSQSSFLMTNNIRVAINAFAFGILFGIGTLILLFQNGLFAFGGPLQVCIEHGMGWRLMNFIAPHGVIELTTIFIAGGAGMMIGFALLFPGDWPRWQAVRKKSAESLILIMGCFPLLVLAGVIEGMISLNRHVDTPLRLLVSGTSVIFLVLYLGFCGWETVSEKKKQATKKTAVLSTAR